MAFDPARAQRFSAKLIDALNGAALALMISVGHRTGLFDVMRDLAPARSPQIALQAGLAERYVGEWLATLATAGVLEHDPSSGTYRLPPEHAAALTRGARPNNLAATFQWIPLLGAVEDEIVKCFAGGGGLPRSSYRRCHAVIAEESDQTVVASLLERILPLAPELPAQLARGCDVLDVGCGSGRALARMAEAFPDSRFTGVDTRPRALELARMDARGLTNLRFEARGATHLEPAGCFDLITAFDAIHDPADAVAVLSSVARALRPGGIFLMRAVAGAVHASAAHPLATFQTTLSCLFSTSVSLSARGAGRGALGGEGAARRVLAEAGFAPVEELALVHDPIHLYYVARKAQDL